MNKYIRTFIKRGLLGIPIGVTINQFAFVIIALRGDQLELTSYVVISQFVIAVLCGFYFAAVSVIFDIEEWSLLRQTITHSIAMLPYFPIAYVADWMPHSTMGVLMFVLNYIIIYIVIWFSFKKYWEKQARAINLKLKNRSF